MKSWTMPGTARKKETNTVKKMLINILFPKRSTAIKEPKRMPKKMLINAMKRVFGTAPAMKRSASGRTLKSIIQSSLFLYGPVSGKARIPFRWQ